MKILLTGATGYIGKRLLITLVNKGYKVVCCVRDINRINPPKSLLHSVQMIEVDFLVKASLKSIPKDIDGAYYLMHSMSSSTNYERLELICATNFREVISRTKSAHVVYLSGIINEKSLSKHLSSRKSVEDELAKGDYHFTTLRAGIIIGSGSASFEIIRDLIEKLPVMVVPKWLRTKCQPIGIRDVLSFLSETLFNPATFDQSFDIGGPDILSYKRMLLGYAQVRGLKRQIIIVPVMTPKLSSYWLYFVTSTSYKLASALVNSMKVEVVCRNNNLNRILNITPIGYTEALQRTLTKIKQQQIVSSWKDSLISGRFNFSISEYINVPTYGCFIFKGSKQIANREKCVERIWEIGGDTGWYYANWLWKFRGFIDQVFGGVGLRRGRTHYNQLSAGDAIDFWRVLFSNKEEGRLLLFAEMKLPGEAWLEFKVLNGTLYQTATFRPKGILGRIYWYAIYLIHGLVFKGLMNQLTKYV
ncbi:MAG: SDR family oxidoreductase [Cyclobacteriaceae bacterium]|nr:SDR family oxidoreductase [Cyclobacteriaceae bacterium]